MVVGTNILHFLRHHTEKSGDSARSRPKTMPVQFSRGRGRFEGRKYQSKNLTMIGWFSAYTLCLIFGLIFSLIFNLLFSLILSFIFVFIPILKFVNPLVEPEQHRSHQDQHQDQQDSDLLPSDSNHRTAAEIDQQYSPYKEDDPVEFWFHFR